MIILTFNSNKKDNLFFNMINNSFYYDIYHKVKFNL